MPRSRSSPAKRAPRPRTRPARRSAPFRQGRPAQPAPGGQQRHRLEHVGLARAIVARQQDEARARLDQRGGVVAEIGQGEAARSPPSSSARRRRNKQGARFAATAKGICDDRSVARMAAHDARRDDVERDDDRVASRSSVIAARTIEEALSDPFGADHAELGRMVSENGDGIRRRRRVARRAIMLDMQADLSAQAAAIGQAR